MTDLTRTNELLEALIRSVDKIADELADLDESVGAIAGELETVNIGRGIS